MIKALIAIGFAFAAGALLIQRHSSGKQKLDAWKLEELRRFHS